jgi:hypothetical protein
VIKRANSKVLHTLVDPVWFSIFFEKHLYDRIYRIFKFVNRITNYLCAPLRISAVKKTFLKASSYPLPINFRPNVRQAALLLLLVLFLRWPSPQAGHAAGNPWPPAGERLRCPVTRDTGISSEPGETEGGLGGADKLRLKGIREQIVLDADVAGLKGRLINGALLHLRSASPKEAPLARLGVSTVAADWVEGNARNFRPRPGTSGFGQAEHQRRDWAYPGGNLMDAVFGRGHTLWKFAECSPPDANGWQACAVDPDVVAARVAGLSAGFCLFDEVGHIWSIQGGKFEYTYFPNRACFSRESGRSAPYLEVWVGFEDREPPQAVEEIRAAVESLPAGEALVAWNTPEDRGGGKTLGFHVEFSRAGTTSAVPRYLVPLAGRPGSEARMHLRGLELAPGERIGLSIRPVDNAGNVGAACVRQITVASGPEPVVLPGAEIQPFQPDSSLPAAGPVRVAVVDLLDKIDPVSGRMIPAQPPDYKGGNHLFSAAQRRVRLQAARNETIGFQINLEGQAEDIRLEFEFEPPSGLKPKLYQFACVEAVDKAGRPAGCLPDPLLPVEGPVSIPSKAGEASPAGQKNLSLIGEVHVPHGEQAGRKSGWITITAGGQTLRLDVDLTVWNFTLPNKLSFVPEMNAYWVVSPDAGYDYYRLAHEHRTCINRLSYGWNGVPDFAPGWSGKGFEWEKWDRYAAPLLDGSAFKDLPRSGEPVDVFYLPFSENWPVSLYEHFRPSYWADEAFGPRYSQELKAAFGAFARHLGERGWKETVFQFYLNNKVYFRGKFQHSSAPWVFDEPIHTQDFWAVRWYGLLWRQAVEAAAADAMLWYRADISWGQYGRNLLWGVTDIEYIGGNNAQKTRMKQDELLLGRKAYFAEYGTANRIDQPNTQPALWCLSAWAKGATGVLPWQTIGGRDAWKKAEQTALFYPHPQGPMPSVRLKAFTRGQQDVEYLELLSFTLKAPRSAVADWLKENLPLAESYYKTDTEDAGTSEYKDVTALDVWRLRQRVGAFLSAKAPPYRRSLVEWKNPRWSEDILPEVGYASPAPAVESYKPVCDAFRP